MKKFFISVGSNTLNIKNKLNKILYLISKFPYTIIVRRSSYYYSYLLKQKQLNYINILIYIKTKLNFKYFLKEVKKIIFKNIDIKILLFKIKRDKNYNIYYKNFYKIDYLLFPILEIKDNLYIKNNKNIIDLINKIKYANIFKIEKYNYI